MTRSKARGGRTRSGRVRSPSPDLTEEGTGPLFPERAEGGEESKPTRHRAGYDSSNRRISGNRIPADYGRREPYSDRGLHEHVRVPRFKQRSLASETDWRTGTVILSILGIAYALGQIIGMMGLCR